MRSLRENEDIFEQDQRDLGISRTTPEQIDIGQKRGSLESEEKSFLGEVARGFTLAPRGDIENTVKTLSSWGFDKAQEANERNKAKEEWRHDEIVKSKSGSIARSLGAGGYSALKIGVQTALSAGAGSLVSGISGISKAKAGANAFMLGFGTDIGLNTYGPSFEDALAKNGGDRDKAHLEAFAKTVVAIGVETSFGGGAVASSLLGKTDDIASPFIRALGKTSPAVQKSLSRALSSPVKRGLSILGEEAITESGMQYGADALIEKVISGYTDKNIKEYMTQLPENIAGALPMAIGGGATAMWSPQAKATRDIAKKMQSEVTEDTTNRAFNKQDDLIKNPELLEPKMAQYNESMNNLQGFLSQHFDPETVSKSMAGVDRITKNLASMTEHADANDLIGQLSVAFFNDNLNIEEVNRIMGEDHISGVVAYLSEQDPAFKQSVTTITRSAQTAIMKQDQEQYEAGIKNSIGEDYSPSEQKVADAVGLRGINKPMYLTPARAKQKLGKSLYQTLALHGRVDGIEGINSPLSAQMTSSGGIIIAEGEILGEQDDHMKTLGDSTRASMHSQRVSEVQTRYDSAKPPSKATQRLDKAMADMDEEVVVRAMATIFDQNLTDAQINRLTDKDIEELSDQAGLGMTRQELDQYNKELADKNAEADVIDVAQKRASQIQQSEQAKVAEQESQVEIAKYQATQQEETQKIVDFEAKYKGELEAINKKRKEEAMANGQKVPRSITTFEELANLSEQDYDQWIMDLDKANQQTMRELTGRLSNHIENKIEAENGEKRIQDFLANNGEMYIPPNQRGIVPDAPVTVAPTDKTETVVKSFDDIPDGVGTTATPVDTKATTGVQTDFLDQMTHIEKAEKLTERLDKATPKAVVPVATQDKQESIIKTDELSEMDNEELQDIIDYNELTDANGLPLQVKPNPSATRTAIRKASNGGDLKFMTETATDSEQQIQPEAQQTTQRTDAETEKILGFYSSDANFITFTKSATAETIVHEWLHHMLSSELMPTAFTYALQKSMTNGWDEEEAITIVSAYFKDMTIPDNADDSTVKALQAIKGAFADTKAKIELNEETTDILNRWMSDAKITPDSKAVATAVLNVMSRANSNRLDPETTLMFATGAELKDMSNKKVREALMNAVMSNVKRNNPNLDSKAIDAIGREWLRNEMRKLGVNVGESANFLRQETTPDNLTHEEIMDAGRTILEGLNLEHQKRTNSGKIMEALEHQGYARSSINNPEFQQLVKSLADQIEVSEMESRKNRKNKQKARASELIKGDLENHGVTVTPEIESLVNKIEQGGKGKGKLVKELDAILEEAGLDNFDKYNQTAFSQSKAETHEYIQGNKWQLIADLTEFPSDEGSRTRAVGGESARALIEHTKDFARSHGIPERSTVLGLVHTYLNQFTEVALVLDDLADGRSDHAVIKVIKSELDAKDRELSEVIFRNKEFVQNLNQTLGIPLANLHLKNETIEYEGKKKKFSWDILLAYYGNTRGKLGKDSKGDFSYVPTYDLFNSDIENSRGDIVLFEAMAKRADDLYKNNKDFKLAVDHADAIFANLKPQIAEATERMNGEPIDFRQGYWPVQRKGRLYTPGQEIDSTYDTLTARKDGDTGGRVGSAIKARRDAEVKGQPIVSYNQNVQQYRQGMDIYIGAFPSLKKVESLLSDIDVKQAFNKTGKADDLQLLNDLLKRERFVNGKSKQMDGLEPQLKAFMSKFRWAQLALKPMVGAVQVFSALAQSGRMKGGFGGIGHAIVAFNAGAKVLASSATGNWENTDMYRMLVKHRSKILRSEAGHYLADMRNAGGKGLGNYEVNIGDKRMSIADLGLSPITIGDRVGRVGGWWAAFQHKMNELTHKGWSEADAEIESARYAEEHTSMVHPGGTVADRNLAQTGSEYLRSVTQFTGYWMKFTSLVRADLYRPMKRAIQQGEGAGGILGNLTRVMLTGKDVQQFGTETSMLKKGFWMVALPATLIGIMRRNRPPEDEEEFVKDLWMYSLMSIPIVGPLVSNHIAYSNSKSSMPFFKAIDDAWKAGEVVKDMVEGGNFNGFKGYNLETMARTTKYAGVPVMLTNIMTKLINGTSYKGDSTSLAILNFVREVVLGGDDIQKVEKAWKDLPDTVKDILSVEINDK